MDNTTIVCPNCGATCKAKDEYCKRCWKRLGTEAVPDKAAQQNMSQSEWVDWEMYIEKNTDRYIDIYKENHDKKLFLHMNWSAFCFGLNWVLYRRMFKVAAIGFVITALLTTLLFAVFIFPHRAEIKSLREDTDSFAGLKIADIVATAQLKCFSIIPLTCAFWGLFGDALYKMHIEKNIKRNNGGTSVAELIGGRVVLSVIELIVLNPLISIVTALILII